MSETPQADRADMRAGAGRPVTADRWLLRRLPGLLLLLAAAGLAGGVSFYWLTHRPKARRRPPERQAVLVEVLPVRPREERVVTRALGTVTPARSISLSSRVGGEIVWVSEKFVPGGRFAAGELMARVDPKDYELAVRLRGAQAKKASADVVQATSAIAQRETDLTRAQCQLELEMGQQSVAKREYQLLGEKVAAEDEALVLRKPQLKQAEADCLAAQAAKRSAEGAREAATANETAARVAVEQAQLDLARAEIRAPFNAMVQSRSVNLGSQVSAGSPLASLVCTDEYWVKVSVPVDELKWIRIPELDSPDGSAARVHHPSAWGPSAHRAGVVARLMGELEPQGRMAVLLLAVKDPLDVSAPLGQRKPLLLGSYVRVEIDGRPVPEAVRVPRTALRDGSRVWVMSGEGTLDIREVKVAWSGQDSVCVSDGLAAGDLLVTSDLGAPVQGMALRTAGSPARAGRPSSRPGPGRREAAGPQEARR